MRNNQTPIEELSDEKLLEFLANATKTYAGCAGHYKAKMNGSLADRYEKELESRGVPIPGLNKLYEDGIFNGDGSY
jgi:hypothetical protein